MIWLLAPSPPLVHNQIRAVTWFITSPLPLSTPFHPPSPRAYNTEAIRWFSRLASNSEVVSIKTDIGQWWWSFMCSPLFDRTPISRDRDCYGLTEISEISGGRQRFGLLWRAGTNSRYSTGESPPMKAGHRELLPHLESTCTRFNTSARRRTRPTAGPERSQQLQIPPSLNSKAILQRVRLLFLLHQHWRTPSFSCAPIFL